MWLKSTTLLPEQIHEDASRSEVRSGKSRKRIAEDGLKVCAEEASARFGVRTSDLPGGLRPGWGDRVPTGLTSADGVTANQALPGTSHVAAGASSAEEAFWALLEHAGYIVW